MSFSILFVTNTENSIEIFKIMIVKGIRILRLQVTTDLVKIR